MIVQDTSDRMGGVGIRNTRKSRVKYNYAILWIRFQATVT